MACCLELVLPCSDIVTTAQGGLYVNRAMQLPCSGSFGKRASASITCSFSLGRSNEKGSLLLPQISGPSSTCLKDRKGVRLAWRGPGWGSAGPHTIFRLLLAALLPPGHSPAWQSTAFPVPGIHGLSAIGRGDY